MSQRSTHLLAYGIITASSTNIPALGTYLAVALFNPDGTSIASGVLPGQCTRVTFSSTGFILGAATNVGATTANLVCQAMVVPQDVVIGGGVKPVVTSSSTAISTGVHVIMFYG